MSAFKNFVLENFGGTNLGIVRDCAIVSKSGHLSDHHEGRAWDWGVNVNNPADVARVGRLFDWLFEGSNDGIRASGITYLIWDGKAWSVKSRKWVPYGGSPHQEHVHISFGWPGAKGETNLYRWLRGEISSGLSPWWSMVALAGGAAFAFAVHRRIG